MEENYEALKQLPIVKDYLKGYNEWREKNAAGMGMKSYSDYNSYLVYSRSNDSVIHPFRELLKTTSHGLLNIFTNIITSGNFLQSEGRRDLTAITTLVLLKDGILIQDRRVCLDFPEHNYEGDYIPMGDYLVSVLEALNSGIDTWRMAWQVNDEEPPI